MCARVLPMQYGARPVLVDGFVGTDDHRTLVSGLPAAQFQQFERQCETTLGDVRAFVDELVAGAVRTVESALRSSSPGPGAANYERFVAPEFGDVADVSGLCRELGSLALYEHYTAEIDAMADYMASMGIDDVMRVPLESAALGVGPNSVRSVGDARLEQCRADFYAIFSPHDGQVQAFETLLYICRQHIYREEWDLDHQSICERNGWNDPLLDKNAAILIWPRRHGKTTVAAVGELVIAMNVPHWSGATISIQYETACITITEMCQRAMSYPRFLRDYGYRTSRGALTFWPRTDRKDIRISFALPQGVSLLSGVGLCSVPPPGTPCFAVGFFFVFFCPALRCPAVCAALPCRLPCPRLLANAQVYWPTERRPPLRICSTTRWMYGADTVCAEVTATTRSWTRPGEWSTSVRCATVASSSGASAPG